MRISGTLAFFLILSNALWSVRSFSFEPYDLQKNEVKIRIGGTEFHFVFSFDLAEIFKSTANEWAQIDRSLRSFCFLGGSKDPSFFR